MSTSVFEVVRANGLLVETATITTTIEFIDLRCVFDGHAWTWGMDGRACQRGCTMFPRRHEKQPFRT